MLERLWNSFSLVDEAFCLRFINYTYLLLKAPNTFITYAFLFIKLSVYSRLPIIAATSFLEPIAFTSLIMCRIDYRFLFDLYLAATLA